ncbi:DUF305 domain-containing protein [Nocardioides sp.]|uniref:Lipoprotein n=1 Tax=metagenome TaxID=256318 RepID=A0A2P2BX42_9ZZZZ
MKKAFSLALLSAAILSLTACGTDSSSSAEGTTDTQNQQDVTFATEMIPHHQQAVQMAELAQSQAASTAVKDLADQIQAAQGPEIDTMTGWLKAWGEDVPDPSMGGMDMGESESMPGMMSDQAMNDLSAASGETFDRMWLESMIAHHEGAVEMAATEIADGSDAGAISLARTIKAAQKAEIATMKKLLAS